MGNDLAEAAYDHLCGTNAGYVIAGVESSTVGTIVTLSPGAVYIKSYKEVFIFEGGSVNIVGGGGDIALRYIEAADPDNPVIYESSTPVNVHVEGKLSVVYIQTQLATDTFLPELVYNTQLSVLDKATQSQVDVGSNDDTFITPNKLFQASWIPKILHSTTILVASGTDTFNQTIAFTNPGNDNYQVLGSFDGQNSGTGVKGLQFEIFYDSSTSMEVTVRSTLATIPTTYLKLLIVKIP
jgi:hypothetical protein